MENTDFSMLFHNVTKIVGMFSTPLLNGITWYYAQNRYLALKNVYVSFKGMGSTSPHYNSIISDPIDG